MGGGATVVVLVVPFVVKFVVRFAADAMSEKKEAENSEDYTGLFSWNVPYTISLKYSNKRVAI